jgi:carboxyl-terminal processing protease
MIRNKLLTLRQFSGVVTLALLVLPIYLTLSESKFVAMISKKISPQSQVAIQKGASQISEKQSDALIDTVLAILETYYVDSSRINNSSLLSGAVDGMTYAFPEAEVSMRENIQRLRLSGKEVQFDYQDSLTHEALKSNLKKMLAFCEATYLDQLLTPSIFSLLGSEKNCTTIVVNAILSSLDAHSSLMSPEEFAELRQGTEGSFGGLGVIVGVKNHLLTVVKPMPRSPALRAGLMKNDKIFSIDGYPTFGRSLDQLVGHMKGPPGSIATLSVLKAGRSSPVEIKVKREVIEVDSVESIPHHSGGTHFLQIVVDSFASRTSKEIINSIREFKRAFPLNGVVLDLRSNPGGLLDQAVEVSDIFLKRGSIVSTKGRKEDVEFATRGIDELDFPVVVLMNEDSASASEIVAGALQDNGRAVIVGQPSFGKGSVQTLFELPDERALKLTIARYFTPSNRSIQNTGITPDVWVQPVLERSENRNLFGSYRYRNEAFLPNHLTSVDSDKQGERRQSVLKGFYLKKAPLISDEENPFDFELNVARLIIEKSASVYGARLPVSAQRSTHLLALSFESIQQELSKSNSRVSSWLKDKFGLNWAGIAQVKSSSLKISVAEDEIRSLGGSKFLVPWRLDNITQNEAQHVSVFIQSQVMGLETTEVILGQVGGRESKSGVFEISVPASASPGKYRVSAGIAIDSLPLEDAMFDFNLTVTPTEYAGLNISARYTDLLHKSNNDFKGMILNPGGRGQVLLEVENTSNVEISDLSIDIVNLSGDQIAAQTFGDRKFSLGKAKRILIDVPVSAGSKIDSDSVSLGFVFRSANFREPVAKAVHLSAAKGEVLRNKSVSH